MTAPVGAIASQLLAPGDPDFSAVSLLCHMDGTNGSTSFPDNSTAGLTVTPTSVTVSTTGPKFGSGCASFGGGTNRLVAAASTGFNFGTGPFTIEFWLKTSLTTLINVLSMNATAATAGAWRYILNNIASGSLEWFEQGTQRISATATGFNNGSYHHHAICKDAAANVRVFVDGVQKGSTFASSFTYGDATNSVIVGLNPDLVTGPLSGSVDDLRITKGIARYTAAFTPPDRPFYNL